MKRHSDRKPYAKKSFGQNFLVDQNYINRIIEALNPQENDTIIEIGPGRGALTERIVEKAGNVIAIELDKDLIPLLQDRFRHFNTFHLVESDALRVDFQEIAKDKKQSGNDKLKLVANLPYYISTAILQKLIEQRGAFSEMVLMFQREVVDRITAEPGNSERGFLTVMVEAYLDTEKLFDIPPVAFRPSPKIWSSVARLTPKDNVEIKDADLFKEIVSAGFQQKRKTILNNLKNISGKLSEQIELSNGVSALLENANIEQSRRAETLTLNEWIKIAEQF